MYSVLFFKSSVQCKETSRDLITCHKVKKDNTFKSVMCFYVLSIFTVIQMFHIKLTLQMDNNHVLVRT